MDDRALERLLEHRILSFAIDGEGIHHRAVIAVLMRILSLVRVPLEIALLPHIVTHKRGLGQRDARDEFVFLDEFLDVRHDNETIVDDVPPFLVGEWCP